VPPEVQPVTRRSHRASALARGLILAAIGLSLVACDAIASLVPTTVDAAAASGAPSASATPSGSGSAVTIEGAYARAMVAALASDRLTTHVVQTSTVTTTVGKIKTTVKTTLTLDLSSRDLKSHLTTTAAGKTSTKDLVVLGKTAYTRTNRGTWSKQFRNPFEKSVTAIIDGLRLARTSANLRYVGIETVGGRKLHHLTASRVLPYAVAGKVTGQYDTFDFWTEENGTPVLAKVSYTAKASNGAKIQGSTEVRFTKFGGPIKIVKPTGVK
jgi:hypothetical protein